MAGVDPDVEGELAASGRNRAQSGKLAMHLHRDEERALGIVLVATGAPKSASSASPANFST